MPKMKTNKSMAKRVKVTASGRLRRHKPGAGHLKSRKSPKRLRGFRKETDVAPGLGKRLRHLLG